MGKHKRERTEQIQRIITTEQAQNASEQHCFNKLVRQGVIVRDEDCKPLSLHDEAMEVMYGKPLTYPVKLNIPESLR